MSISRKLLIGYIFSFPLINALSPRPWIPLSFALALLAIPLQLLTKSKNPIRISNSDIHFLLILGLGIMPILPSANSGQQNYLYSAAWVAIVIVEFVFVRMWIVRSGLTFDDISRVSRKAITFLSCAIVFEFITANIYGIYLSDLIPFNISEFPDADMLNNFKRPRGFSAEAGFTAVVYETLVPISLYRFNRFMQVKVSYLLLAVTGYLLLGSGASLISTSLAILLYLLAETQVKLKSILILIVAALIGIGFLQIIEGYDVLYEVIGRKVEALFFGQIDDENPSTHVSRNYVYNQMLSIIANYPLGIGWGMLSQLYHSNVLLHNIDPILSRGAISLFLEITVSAGVFGGLIFIRLVANTIKNLFTRKGKPEKLLLISLTAVSIHHIAILELSMPMFWFILALATVVIEQTPSSKQENPGK